LKKYSAKPISLRGIFFPSTEISVFRKPRKVCDAGSYFDLVSGFDTIYIYACKKSCPVINDPGTTRAFVATIADEFAFGNLYVVLKFI
jgi:hypothetical protein